MAVHTNVHFRVHVQFEFTFTFTFVYMFMFTFTFVFMFASVPDMHMRPHVLECSPLADRVTGSKYMYLHMTIRSTTFSLPFLFTLGMYSYVATNHAYNNVLCALSMTNSEYK